MTGCRTPVTIEQLDPLEAHLRANVNVLSADALSVDTLQVARLACLPVDLIERNPQAAIQQLDNAAMRNNPGALFAVAEIALREARNAESQHQRDALSSYMLAAARAYQYLFQLPTTDAERAFVTAFARYTTTSGMPAMMARTHSPLM